MSTVTISKKEYNDLVDKKFRYEYLRQVIEFDIFSSPPVKDANEILQAFKLTKKYNSKFIQSLGKGFRRSSYFKK